MPITPNTKLSQLRGSHPPPLVSILTPFLNAEPYLAEALDSILSQTSHCRWEVLLVDDGSQDGSLEIARKYSSAMPQHFRIFQHARGANLGTSASRNLALRHARGKYLAMLDADDTWLPDMLKQQLALFERYPEADLVYANAERTWEMHVPYNSVRGSEGLNELPQLLPPGTAQGLLPPTYPLPWFLEDETLVPCTCTVLVRTVAARAVGGFEDCFNGLYDDQAFYAKLMMEGRVAVQDRCVARYRRHAGSCCGKTWHDTPTQQHARERFTSWLATYAASLKEDTLRPLAAD